MPANETSASLSLFLGMATARSTSGPSAQPTASAADGTVPAPSPAFLQAFLRAQAGKPAATESPEAPAPGSAELAAPLQAVVAKEILPVTDELTESLNALAIAIQAPLVPMAEEAPQAVVPDLEIPPPAANVVPSVPQSRTGSAPQVMPAALQNWLSVPAMPEPKVVADVPPVVAEAPAPESDDSAATTPTIPAGLQAFLTAVWGTPAPVAAPPPKSVAHVTEIIATSSEVAPVEQPALPVISTVATTSAVPVPQIALPVATTPEDNPPPVELSVTTPSSVAAPPVTPSAPPVAVQPATAVAAEFVPGPPAALAAVAQPTLPTAVATAVPAKPAPAPAPVNKGDDAPLAEPEATAQTTSALPVAVPATTPMASHTAVVASATTPLAARPSGASPADAILPSGTQVSPDASSEPVVPETIGSSANEGLPAASEGDAPSRSDLNSNPFAVREAGSVEASSRGIPQVSPQDTRALVDKVTELMQRSHDTGQQLALEITPPDMGRVRIQVHAEGGLLTASVETQTESARQLLTERLPELRESLQQQGVTLDRIEITQQDNQPTEGGMSDGSWQSSQHDDQPQPVYFDSEEDLTAESEPVLAAGSLQLGELNVRI